MNFNRVILAGNLTRDVELRHTPSGTAVADVGLAVNERVKQNDQWTERPHFFDCTLWGRTAEVASEYLRKGSKVLVEGRLSFEQWESDGQKRSKVKVIVEKLQMGSRQQRDEQNQEPPRSQQAASMNQDAGNDSIPF